MDSSSGMLSFEPSNGVGGDLSNQDLLSNASSQSFNSLDDCDLTELTRNLKVGKDESGESDLVESDHYDRRYVLTEEEREDVLNLKQSCDREGIAYRSIFELAKYTLVSSSIKNVKKRRLDSFQRIKKKHQFVQEHKLDEFDIWNCLESLEIGMPNWTLACGKVDGKWCVGYSSSGVNPNFLRDVPNALEIVCKVEMLRYDLAAADLEEARRGFYLVGTAKDLQASPLGCFRMASNLRVLYDKMHANRIKGLFFEVPTTVARLSSILLAVLPRKIKERLVVKSSLMETKLYKEHKIDYVKNMPTKLEGRENMAVKDWISERLDHRNKTDKLVVL